MNPTDRAISPATTAVFAVVGGIAVANVYYIQPILELIASDFHVGARVTGTVATMLQAGYALGILAFVPLGDLVQRRPLIVGMFACVTLALAGVTFAPTIALLAAGIMLVGVTTTAAQILLPFAADLAEPARRGRVLGTVQTGLIVGTLAARALGGLIGEHFGWRAVFAFATVVAALATAALARVLPLRAPSTHLRYGALLATLPGFVARYPALRASMGLGFLSFSVFSGLWTVFAFHVRALGYGADTVGAIGLVSFVGALTAARFGAFADRRGTLVAGTLAWCTTLVSFVAYLVAGGSLAGVVVASALMALGTQMTQIANQTRIFALDDSGRSRINTIYMFTNFLGGAFGSLVAAGAYAAGGWNATCVAMIANVTAMGAFLLWYRRMLAPASPARFAPDARSF